MFAQVMSLVGSAEADLLLLPLLLLLAFIGSQCHLSV